MNRRVSLTRNGQLLLPMVDLIEQSRMAVDELVDVLGRPSIEAVLGLLARQVARRSAAGQGPDRKGPKALEEEVRSAGKEP